MNGIIYEIRYLEYRINWSPEVLDQKTKNRKKKQYGTSLLRLRI